MLPTTTNDYRVAQVFNRDRADECRLSLLIPTDFPARPGVSKIMTFVSRKLGGGMKPCDCWCLLLLSVLAAGWLTSCGGKETAGPSAPPEVLIMKAGTRDVPVYREWIGTLDGSENAEIRARVTGYLLKRDYQEGSLVKKGDLLFEIDPRPFEAALAEAKSQLEQAKATQVASQADAERSKTMFEKRAISEKEYINKTQLNESNMAKIAALEANVEQAQLNVNFCRVTSPVDGIAGIAQAQVGDLVGAGNNTVLTTVSTLDPMKIIFPVSEADYLAASRRVQETMSKPFDERPETIELILADGSIFPHKARLLSVDRQVKASTGTILVTALLPNPGNLLRPGFFARARIVANVLKNAVVVPQRAVKEVQGSYQLAIVDADGKAEIRPVQVGPRTGTDWVITSGVKPGEQVVVEGLQKVKAGAPVSAKPWENKNDEARMTKPEANPKPE
jgi:membrane fusion protein, multidrug efflux system